jgi:tetratricopeptide (TPR) repeat protein
MAESNELSWRELRDSIWLAERIAEIENRSEAPGSQDKPAAGAAPETHRQSSAEHPSPSPSPEDRPQRADEPPGPDHEKDSGPVQLFRHRPPDPRPSVDDGEVLVRLRSDRRPAAPGGTREMAAFSRAMRPFRTTAAAPDRVELDEVGTATAAAEDPYWSPVFRPARERAWDVVLVVDAHLTMEIWAATLHAFHAQLQRQGFRDVLLRYLVTGGTRSQDVRAIANREAPDRGTGVVVPASRRIILVVTDGAAPAWRSGAAMQVLADWGRHHPVAAIHLLPETRWHLTGLHGAAMRLQSQHPGGPNAALRYVSQGLAGESEDRGSGLNGTTIPVPVLEFEPRWLAAWSRLVADEREEWVDLAADLVVVGTQVADVAHLEAAQAAAGAKRSENAFRAVADFRESVSPDAFRLATYLAAVPLDLRLMQSVQAKMLPGSTPRHLSEILVSPLVRVQEPVQPSAGEITVAFEFTTGVREELLASGRNTDIIRVARVVEDEVGSSPAHHLLSAVLAAPDRAPAPEVRAETLPWQRVEAAVLTALSGRFLPRARRIGTEIQLYDRALAVHDRARTPVVSTPLEPSPGSSPGATTKGPMVQSALEQQNVDAAAERTDGRSRRSPRGPALFGNVPPKNPNFTGRGELLEQLHAKIRSEGMTTAVLPHALHGMGGVGKTLLAVEYLYRYVQSYDLIWWIPAERTATIAASLVELASRLGLSGGSEANTAVPMVLDALQKGEPQANWLLVFDNAESPEYVLPYLPRGGPGNILITSRNPRWAEVGTPLEVNVFRREESKELLQRRGPELLDQDADRLANALGDLPLAIEQAAAWRAATGMPAAEYLELLEEKTAELLQVSRPMDYPTPVIAAWNVSLDRVAAENPAALQLLQVCSFFAAEPIPRAVLTGARAHDVLPALDVALRNPIKFGQALREIGKYSLAKTDHRTNSIQVHRLVQTALIARMSADEQATIRHAAHVILAANDPNDPESPASFDRYTELYPHVMASRVIDCQDRWSRALVINEARYLYRFGEHQASRALAQEAYDRWSVGQGPEDPQTLEIAKWLGFVLFAVGRYKDASALNAATLRLYESFAAQGNEDREGYLEALRNTQADACVKGDFAEAKSIAQRVLDGSIAAFGDEDPATLNAAHNVAVTLRLCGEFERAREVDEQTLDRKQQILGTEHPLTMHTRLGLLVDLRELGEYRTALGLHEDALAQCRRLLGELNPTTLLARRLTAVALRKAGQHREARDVSELVSSQLVRRYTLDHPESMAAMSNLSIDLRQTGDLAQARSVGMEIHERYGMTLGSDHPHTLSAGVNLAITFRLLGEHSRARRIDEDALALFNHRLGQDHPNTLVCATNLAADLAAAGEHEAALGLDLETLERLERVFSPDHPTALACAINLALDLYAVGRDEEANRRYADVTARLRVVLGEEHPATMVVIDRRRRADSDIDPMPL